MFVKGHRVYRGHRGASRSGSPILLTILVLLLIALLLAFSLLPEYVVYHPDGVEMVVPMLQESGEGYTVESAEAPSAYTGDATATIQVAEPDYSLVSLADTSGLQYLNGYYVPFSKVNAKGLETAVKEAERSGVKGLVLEMKDESGKLAWMSGVATASSNAANSTWDPTAYLSELKADGWKLTAEICCAVDTLLATANPDVALRDRMTGAPYTDSLGGWVDLWNRDVRTYTKELCTDLMAMGFDEIILSRVEHPLAEVTYTREIAGSLTREASAMNFAIAVRTALNDTLEEKSVHLSARVPHDVLTTGTDNGQSMDNFLKVFDRLVIETETYSEDAPVFTEKKIDSTLRFVPQMTWTFGGGSWILDPTVGAKTEG